MNLTSDDDTEKIAEELHKGNPRFLSNLSSCTDDCKIWLQMVREDYPIPSKNITVFASEENFKEIA